MHSATYQPSAAHSDREDIPVFSVVIAFEDFNTGKQAKCAYDFLCANLSYEWRVTSQMWKFEVLSIPELREMAAKDAESASLIIVSSRGDRELPADVKDWVEMWLGYQGGAVALVALFDCPPEQAEHARTIQSYLKRVAERGHMEFFTWPQVGPIMEGRQHIVGLDRQRQLAEEPLVAVGGEACCGKGFDHTGRN